MEWKIQCDRCERWFPREKLILVLEFEGEGEHLCARCLLYFLGEILRTVI